MLPAGPEQQPLDQSDPPNRNWKPQGNVGFVLEHGTPPLPLACLVQLVLVTEVLGVTSFWWQKFLVAEVLGGSSLLEVSCKVFRRAFACNSLKGKLCRHVRHKFLVAEVLDGSFLQDLQEAS